MTDPLDAQDRERLVELFDVAAELTLSEREDLIERECGSRPQLRGELEKLIATLDGEDVLERMRSGGAPSVGALSGSSVGPYRLGDLIGDGGMGEVYAAERLSPIVRRVALKVIKPGLNSVEVLARFEAERQALARMSHPNVACVYDGGATDQGRPYFAMELIDGEPITGYCDRRRLSTRARIELFLDVCEGVRHAHQRGIIHRDLKPSNLLVATEDGVPVPKVIDFGIARATTGRLAERTLQTQLGRVVGTLDYMSPEQADPGSAEIDTRSDVYSLGVVLYELLSGLRPFELTSAGDVPLSDLQRRIREDDPPTPSTRLRRQTDTATAAGPLRGTDGHALIRQLAGDLDHICLRALEKEPGRRYQSVGELADDLRRYLAHEPVVATSAGALYRARKYVRRHRAGVSAGVVVAAAIGVGAFGFVSGRLEAAAKGRQLLELEDARVLAQLVDRADDELWPPYPGGGRVEEMGAWVDQARALANRRDRHVRALETIRARALPASEPEGDRRDWGFQSYDDQLLHDMLADLVSGLEVLESELLDDRPRSEVEAPGPHGWSVPQRIAYAGLIEASLAPGGEVAAAWEAALPEILLDYPGLELQPQPGLLPIGRDPRSGLWEFAHLLTGAAPTRGEDGVLEIDAETGLVLVLLRGGTFWAGAQREDPELPNYDPQANPGESPVREVELAPFFMSKYEMTRGQWARFTGDQRSLSEANGPQAAERPAQWVSWNDCDRVTARLGLELPDEQQWEYAARGGTDSPWWTGDEEGSLEGRTNLLDSRTAALWPYWASSSHPAPWDDEDVGTAPVWRSSPNGFGLHEVTGNVLEWTSSLAFPVEAGSGVDLSRVPRRARGGCNRMGTHAARSAFRELGNMPDFAMGTLGLRPAMSIVADG
ncbi:bifunctional serine/threonine-protein kinase/formylglycine-generating enzyme family protein [Engelhardtia mirabilis]|uniref:bifunctional serine/threonine-protein kinase/formylglycine-generating enzyme family protein n=1 Tax=Engelhardtia mirabilis TaxID=2528011 RepID=UPI003AF35F8D